MLSKKRTGASRVDDTRLCRVHRRSTRSDSGENLGRVGDESALGRDKLRRVAIDDSLSRFSNGRSGRHIVVYLDCCLRSSG